MAGGAAANAPDILLLVDISGSMNSPINPSEPTCGSCMGSSCPGTCPTRVAILRNALTAYLQPNATLARWGITTFPSAATFTPSGCAPASTQTVAMLDPSTPTSTSTLSTQSAQVRNVASGLGIVTTIVGGTPTGPSLRFAATIPALATSSSARARGIVLITDGLPNCNPANPLSCMSQPPPPVDLCTLGANCTASYCQAGYLDQTGTVQAVAALRLAGVKTAIVVIDNAPTAQVTSVMNAMADEGGATACSPTNPGCLQRFFPANDQASLLTAITSAVARVSVP